MLVRIKFNAGDAKGFTYRWEGEGELKLGELVRVPTRRSISTAEVIALDVEQPTDQRGQPIECKAIIGKLEAEGVANV